eukprot:TRINITY_DN10885_c0_g1_i1.p1 TRINITY_DN10885_c0_g1~~TRINITY_DN10885_c0_g1_i1.p1  ORF type:complete len:194 (-),score=55.64 TRINITY_DN10885_c0_g1_i1:87-668(-)
MSDRGQRETALLKQNLEEQLNRLVEQLQDLEDEYDQFDDDEREDMRIDTLFEMQEFTKNLEVLTSGNMTLVSELASLQIAMQLAVSEAFKTPDVIKMFAKKDNGSLRDRLTGLQRDKKLGKVTKGQFNQQVVEILSALKKLGEELSPKEEHFLSQHITPSLAEFETSGNENVGSGASRNILKAAASGIASAQN